MTKWPNLVNHFF